MSTTVTFDEACQRLAALSTGDVLDGLRRAVDRHGPDTLYTDRHPGFDANDLAASCLYVHPATGQGCCIVGVFLEGMGLLRFTEEGVAVEGLNLMAGDDVQHVARVLRAAQYTQDAGGTWGDALDAAERSALNVPSGTAVA